MNKIQIAAQLGMKIQSWNQLIMLLIENDWWESYDGQTDDELVEAWTAQLCAWEELAKLERPTPRRWSVSSHVDEMRCRKL